MTDHTNKIEQLQRALLQTSNLRNLSRSTSGHKKQKTGLATSSRSTKYQSAKIIECTQNVVELRKLINNWNKLEKAKKASLNRLQHERWALEEEYSRLLGEREESDLQESFQFEPGFRFKANGDIKKPTKKEVTKVVEYIKNWNAVKKGVKKDNSGMECRGSNASIPTGIDPIVGVASENSKPYFGSKSRQESKTMTEDRLSRDDDTILGTMNVTKAIEETEKVIKELKSTEKMSRAKGTYSQGSGSFLRALSKENQYSGGPDAVRSHCEMNKALACLNKRQVNHKRKGFKDNCAACEFKLSSHKDDSLDKKLEQLKRPLKKWKSVWINPSNESHAVQSVQSKSSRTGIRELTSATENSKIFSSSKKPSKKEARPMSETNVLKVEVKQKKNGSVMYTKSTDYVDQDEWKHCHECDEHIERNSVTDGNDDCRHSVDKMTPRTTENIRGIARMLLRHSPCSIPRSWDDSSESIEGIRGKAISEKDLKYTEPLYHQMIERNSISSKESQQVLQEMNRLNFTEKHLSNVELPSKGARKNNQGINNPWVAVKRDVIKHREQLFETLRKNTSKNGGRSRPKSRKSSVSSVKAFKQLAEMERKESECKISNFVQKLPPPSVSVERWRAHDGVNKSVYEVYAPNPHCEKDLDYEKDPYAVNPDLLLREMNECKLLTRKAPTNLGSSHL